MFLNVDKMLPLHVRFLSDMDECRLPGAGRLWGSIMVEHASLHFTLLRIEVDYLYTAQEDCASL